MFVFLFHGKSFSYSSIFLTHGKQDLDLDLFAGFDVMNTDLGPEATYLTAWGLLTSRAVQHCGAGEITKAIRFLPLSDIKKLPLAKYFRLIVGYTSTRTWLTSPP